MKKIIAAVSAFMLIIVGLFTLASCSSKTFYSEWKKAGAVIEKTNVFESVTVDEAKKMIDAKTPFALFLGSSEEADSVADVTAIQYAADAKNYDGKIYFLTTTKYKKLSQKKEIKEKLSIDIADMGNNVICVMYDETGKAKYNTSIANINDAELRQFKLKEDDKEFNITMIFEFAVVKFPYKAE